MSPNLQAAILALLITANTALQEWRLRQVRAELERVRETGGAILEKVPGDPWTH